MKDIELEFTDLLGVRIEPGVLIAFGRSGQGTKEMEIGIVSDVNIYSKRGKARAYIFGLDKKFERVGTSYDYRTISENINPKKTWTELTHRCKISGNILSQGHIIIIKNPLYAINNPNIAEQLRIADMAIDKGLLPKGYELGVPTSEYSDS